MNNFYYGIIGFSQIMDGLLTIRALNNPLISIYEFNPFISYLNNIAPISIIGYKILALIILLGLLSSMNEKSKIGFNISIFTVLILSMIGMFTGIYSYLGGY